MVRSNDEKDVIVNVTVPDREGHYRVEMIARDSQTGQEIGRQQAFLRVE
jgi:hypothetical protein